MKLQYWGALFLEGGLIMKNLALEIAQAQQLEGLATLDDVRRAKLGMPFDDMLAGIKKLAAKVNPVEIVTPANAGKEKAAFMEGLEGKDDLFHPVFEYDAAPLERIVDLRRLVREIPVARRTMASYKYRSEPPRRPLGGRVSVEEMLQIIGRNRLSDLETSIDMAEAILRNDVEEGFEAMKTKYGPLEHELVEEANERAAKLLEKAEAGETEAEGPGVMLSKDEYDKLRNLKFNAQEMAAWFEKAMRAGGVEGEFPVIADVRAQYIDVRDKSADGPEIVIPADREVDAFELLQLIGHEIGCHVLDSVAGQRLFKGLGGGILKSDDERMYEGHAMLQDRQFKAMYLGIDWEPLPWYVLVTHAAMNGLGFVDCAETLKSYIKVIDPEHMPTEVWKHCYRVFRGSRDTFAQKSRRPWVFLKDKGYLEGYLMAKELVDAGLSQWLELGIFRPEELVLIARTVKLDTLTPRTDVVRAMVGEMLS